MKGKTLKVGLLVLTGALLLTACGEAKNNGAGHFTYNTYLETKPKTWNVHNWETSDESYIPAFCEMGLYDLQLNSTKDGYEIVSEMAADMPVDVTTSITNAEMDKYGYPGNLDKGYVWEIPLNPNACWEDGTPINADTYVESMKYQLDSKMVNFRADSYYASSFVIANAEKYFKQGRKTIEELYSELDKSTGEVPDNVCIDGYYYINLARYTSYVASVFSGTDTSTTFYTVLNNRADASTDTLELAAQRITDAVVYYCWKYEDHTGDYKKDWDEIEGYSKLSSVKSEMLNYNINIDKFDDVKVLVRSKKDDSSEAGAVEYSSTLLKADLNTVVNGLARDGAKSWAWKKPLFANRYNDYKQPWGDEGTAEAKESGVGLVKTGEYKIKLFLSQAITALDLKFSLSSNWIVKTDLYKKLIVQTAEGLVSTQYATPDKGVEGYASYGPYKLVSMEAGKSFKIDRNDKWYGYTDGKHVGQYKMDTLYTRIITDHTTALNEFLAGRLDDFGLNRNDVKNYGGSSRLTRTYESYTQKISINSNRTKLLENQKNAKDAKANKTILANDDFRKGLSLAMNRNEFASQATAGSKAFTSLLNDLYLTDVEDGEMYRRTPQGQGVYNAVYGKLGGNPYAADYKEAALSESANGYNLNMGTFFVAKAIEQELKSNADGHLEANQTIKIDFRVYDNESETTIDMLNFISGQFNTVIEAAVAKLKEKQVLKSDENISIKIDSIKDEDYYNTAKKGGYDMIFSTWGGAAINPVGLMQVYCDSTFDSNCEYGFKGQQDKVMIEIDADGNGKIDEGENKSYNAWWTEASGITENDDKVTEFDKWNTKHQKILNILAGLEAGIINRFEAIPLVARATSSLNSFKIENGTESYINLIGYGGIRHMTFNYDDAEWDAFVAKNKDKLSDLYKD